METTNKNNEIERVEYLTANDVIRRALQLPMAVSLFKEFWWQGEINILFAESNLGKSLLAVQIAEKVAKTQKVMYLDYELSERQFLSRYTNEQTKVPYYFSDNLFRPSLRIEQILDDNEIEEHLFNLVKEAIIQQGVKIFIVDNITYLCGNLENGKQASRLMRKLCELKQVYGVSIMVVAHTHKRIPTNPITKDDLAGSKKLMNFCDSAFAIGQSAQDSKLLYLKQIKVREGKFIYGGDNVLVCHIDNEDNFPHFVEIGVENEEKLLRKSKLEDKQTMKTQAYIMHDEGMSNRRIAKELGISEGSVRNWLKEFSNETYSMMYN